MGQDEADRLQDMLEQAEGWPIWSADRTGGQDTNTYVQVGKYGKSMRDIALWVAMRENDREAIIKETAWERDRPLHLDPLPERISTAYSDLLYGSEPEFIAADDDDQPNMDEMTKEQGLAMELKRWVDQSVSEGECWYRMWTDRNVSDWPLVENYSRLDVVPLFVGRKIIAAAFLENILEQKITVESQVHVIIWRHIEIQTVSYVRNLLYKGSYGTLGVEMPLSTLPDTKDLDQDWDHGLPFMLAGRFPNKLGRDFGIGVSEYQGIRDLLLDLNEARTIMAENARLVLKARMVVPADAIDENGQWDASQDLIIRETLDEEMTGKTGGPYAVLEYNFQASAIIAHKNELTLDALSRAGLAEQFVQESRGGGQAFTGTALRTRLIPTTLAASGKARPYDRGVPQMLKKSAMLSALPTERGGCGQSWKAASELPVQKRASVLPEDENEEVQRHVMAVQGEVESIQYAIESLHPDWDEEAVEMEVLRIYHDRSVGPTFSGPNDTPEDLQALNLPNTVPGGPNSAVPGPSDVLGSTQPGVATTSPNVDGQLPGVKPPAVTAGGPK